MIASLMRLAIDTSAGIAVATMLRASTSAPLAAAAAVVAAGLASRNRVTRAARNPLEHPVRPVEPRPPRLPRNPPSPPPSRADAALHSRAPHRGRIVIAVAIATVLAAAVAIGPLPTAVALASILLLRRLRPIRAARRQRVAIERDLPAAIDLLVLSVRAGLTPFQAVRELATSSDGAISDAFSEVVRRTERGQPFADALTALGELLGAQAGGLADVIATNDRHGLPLAQVLDQLTTEVRNARQRFDQAEARKLPVRLAFPLVVCTLPSFVLLAIAPAVIAALSSLGGAAW